MLKLKPNLPLDYTLCTMTVTAYRREGLTRRVIEGVHYEFTHRREVLTGRESLSREFLLVIPGQDPLAPGDKVVLGIGPENVSWEELNPARYPTLGVVKTVKPRYFQGKPCHTEAWG